MLRAMIASIVKTFEARLLSSIIDFTCESTISIEKLVD